MPGEKWKAQDQHTCGVQDAGVPLSPARGVCSLKGRQSYRPPARNGRYTFKGVGGKRPACNMPEGRPAEIGL